MFGTRTAQLTGRDALVAAAHVGGRLPTPEEIDEALPIAFMTTPVLLPTRAMRAEMPRLPGELSRHWEVRLRARMASLEWLIEHDRIAFEQLAAAGWAGETIALNFGKHIVSQPHANLMQIKGWRQNGAWIQRGLRPQHGADHCDYATKTMVVWDEPAPEIAPVESTGRQICPKGWL